MLKFQVCKPATANLHKTQTCSLIKELLPVWLDKNSVQKILFGMIFIYCSIIVPLWAYFANEHVDWKTLVTCSLFAKEVLLASTRGNV